MLREYAIDPEAIDNWKDFRHFVDQCGVEHGRLISRFPKDWRRLVHEATRNCGDVERTKIVEKLATIKEKMIASSRTYDGTKSWLANAEEQQTTRPFHAIITKTNPNRSPHVCIADDVDENTPCWKPVRQKTVARQGAELAECASPLFRISRELLLVDPYFEPAVNRWRKSLTALLVRAVSESPGLKRIEIHAEDKSSTAFWTPDSLARLSACVPRGHVLRLVRWRSREAGPRLHARYILTERGGLHVDSGLDEDSRGGTTPVALLDKAFHTQIWNDFQDASSIYDFKDEAVVEGVLSRS